METWRLLTTWDEPPAFHMGLDEALLEDEGPPTLRLYTWSDDPLSLGYFQRHGEVDAARRAGAVVRRITGGGAIHHVRELTFSITLALAHPLYRGPVASSYERIHAAIVRALAAFGIRGGLRGDARLRSDRSGTGMCFHRSTALDVVWDGRKGAGSAQRRRGGRVLHHGSIKLGSSPLEGDVATVSGGAREDVDAGRFAAALVDAFGELHDLRFDPGSPTAAEAREARRRGGRYASEAFVRRR